ncbi:unnamed protein product [Phytophthora lilii]|uniref:Unnamed protein product n=1 Tax=Phytophthora lilii TaxID=2077276 RepID=A0A9W6UFJ6_9STRA|nr:unnamed protein product [Phytophthora lilii]
MATCSHPSSQSFNVLDANSSHNSSLHVMSGEELRGLSLEDAELLPSFLEDLGDADLLPTSGDGAVAAAAPFAGFQPSPETSFSRVFGSFAVCGGALATPTLPHAATDAALDAQHFAPSLARKLAGTRAADDRPRPPMQNSTRVRQKEELRYLRDKVQTLEQELAGRRRALMAPADAGQLRTGRRARAARWQRVAKHQLVEKQRAEMQNLQLRQSLADQLKLARSLQKLLKRHAARKDEGSETAQLQARLQFSDYGDAASEASLYETLLRDMDAVYAEVDTICARHPVMQSMEEGSNVSSLHIGETEALYLEATNSKVVPFGMEETCAAVWRCLSKDHVKLADGTYHGVASSPDSIRAKAITTLRVDNTQARMQMRFAMKKYVERDRVVITLESASESEGPRDVLHGLKMMQRAWVVIRPVPFEPDDGDNTAEDEVPEETIIQLCMRLTPSLSAAVLGTPGQRTGAVTELLLAAVHRNLGWLFQTVENILMEHNFGGAPL